MTSYREIVYLVLDEIKSLNGDSLITEEHVIFLANIYRMYLLELKKAKSGTSSLSTSNELTLCINLEKTSEYPGLDYCNDQFLKSVEEIPDALDEESLKVYPSSYFNIYITFVSKDKFKYVGYNKYMLNIIYCTLGQDNHLYFKGNNPQFMYLTSAKVTGIFEDSSAAAELTCDTSDSGCDILDQPFPLEADLIPTMNDLIIKELYGAEWRQGDDLNNAKDDLSDLIAYMAKNTKSSLAKQLSDS